MSLYEYHAMAEKIQEGWLNKKNGCFMLVQIETN